MAENFLFLKNDYNSASGKIFLNHNKISDTAYALLFSGATGQAYVYNLSESDQLSWSGVSTPIWGDWFSRFLTNADFNGDGTG